MIGIAVVLDNWRDHIGPVKSAASAEVILAVVVELEGLAALQRHRAVDSPPVLQALHASAHSWNFVPEYPGEPFAEIEIRGAIFALGIVAVLRLCGIGFEVLAVARIVGRF